MGDGLKLHGASCYFWAHTSGTRWHCKGRPLEISEGRWEEPSRLTLESDESLWYRSWVRDPKIVADLDTVLAGAGSYGFSLVGFRHEVSGKLAMGSFELR